MPKKQNQKISNGSQSKQSNQINSHKILRISKAVSIPYSSVLENFSHGIVKFMGTATGFTIAIVYTIMWLIAGVWTNFSSHWESALIVSFSLMTFLIIFLTQRAHNKEILAVHVKLNEIINATAKADNKLINIEESSEKVIHKVNTDQ